MKNQIVSQKFIAEKLGISRSAVSMILSNHGDKYSSALRERVLSTAEELDYHPNLSASTMRHGFNPNTVAVIANSENTDSMKCCFRLFEALNQCEKVARAFCGSNLKDIFRDIINNQIQYVVCSRNSQEERQTCARLARTYGLKMVFLTSEQEFSDFPVFDSDNKGIIKQIMSYLHSLGHRRMIYFHGDNLNCIQCPRIQSFLSNISYLNLSVKNQHIYTGKMIQKDFLRFLSETQPTAVIATDPLVAIWIQLTFQRYEISVPSDFSLITYGDSNLLKLMTETPISGFAESDMSERTKDIFKYLFQDHPQTKASSHTRFYKGRLIDRKSCAAPRTDDTHLTHIFQKFL